MKTYETNILALAAYMYIRTDVLSYEGIDATDTNKIFFKFAPYEKAIEVREEFNNSPYAEYADSFQRLKTLVFETKRNARQ